MNTDLLKAAGVDYAFGVKRFAGRANLYEKALLKFTRDTTITRVRDAYAAGDRAALLSGAHEFKGMCGNIGLTVLYDAAEAVVRLLRSDGYTAAELDAAYSSLDASYNTILEAVIAAFGLPEA